MIGLGLVIKLGVPFGIFQGHQVKRTQVLVTLGSIRERKLARVKACSKFFPRDRAVLQLGRAETVKCLKPPCVEASETFASSYLPAAMQNSVLQCLMHEQSETCLLVANNHCCSLRSIVTMQRQIGRATHDNKNE